MIDPLTKALASWKGRDWLQARFAELGHHVHEKYQQHIQKFCQLNGNENNLQLYWSELAMEYMVSGGKTDSLTRSFVSASHYRSAYLDELSNKLVSDQSVDGSVPLHPCVRRWQGVNRESRSQIAFGLFDELQAEKRIEALRLGIDSTPRSVRKEVDNQAARYGYERSWSSNAGVKAAWVLRARDTGLVFLCGLENYATSSRLPLIFEIGHVDYPNYQFNLGDFRVIVPGFEYYATAWEVADVKLGVSASLGLLKTLTMSFEE